MSDDLMTMFDETIADGGTSEDVVENSLGRNATIHSGDDISDETDEVSEDEVDGSVDETEDIDSEGEAQSDDEDVTEDEFDFDSIKDKTVSVTVNGETFEVPIAELRNGYMRQADYTRKTQQVAADANVLKWARDMQEAFRVDPAGSIKLLQQQFGLLDDKADEFEDLDPEIKPIVAELKRTQAELAALRSKAEQSDQERVNAQVQAELETMQSKYSDFDPMVVLPIAIENGLSMEKAYKLWRADYLEQESVAQAAARKKAEEAAAKREKSRKVAKQVSSGSGRKAEASDDWKSLTSFEEIFAYEMEQTKS